MRSWRSRLSRRRSSLAARSSSRAIERSSPGDLSVGDQRAQALEAIERDEAGDAGVLGVVLLLGGAAPTGHEIRVDRDDHVASVDETLDQHAVAGLDDDPDLGRIRLEFRDLGDQRVHRLGCVLHARDLDDAVVGSSQRDQVDFSDQSMPTPSTSPPLSTGKWQGRRHGVVLMDQSSELRHRGPPHPCHQRMRNSAARQRPETFRPTDFSSRAAN